MNVKDEYLLMESIFNENINVFLESEVSEFNEFKKTIFKKMGFESIPTEKEWSDSKFRESNKQAITKLENFIKQKIGMKNLTESSIKEWIEKKKKNIGSNILNKFINLKTIFLKKRTVNEEHILNESVFYVFPISYIIFIILMIFFSDIKGKDSDKKE